MAMQAAKRANVSLDLVQMIVMLEVLGSKWLISTLKIDVHCCCPGINVISYIKDRQVAVC